MSFVGFHVTACVPPSVDLSGLKSTDDLGPVPLDEAASIIAFSRNGWLNERLDDVARGHRLALLPTREVPAVVAWGASLDGFAARLRDFLQRLAHERGLLPREAQELAEEDEVLRCLAMGPPTHQAALRAFKSASARDPEGEGLESLLCLLWCQLRLAEHASASGLQYLSVRSP